MASASNTSRRRAPFRRQARQSGQFAKECGCLNHDAFAADESFHLLKACNCSRRTAYKKLVESGLLSLTSRWICNLCLKYSESHFCASTNTRFSSTFGEVGFDESQQVPEAQATQEVQQENLMDDSTSTYNETAHSSFQSDPSSHTENVTRKAPYEILTDNANHLADSLNQCNDWNCYDKKLRDAIARLAHALGALIENDIYWQSQKMNLEYKTLKVEDGLEWLTQKNQVLISFLEGCTKVSLKQDTPPKKIRAFLTAVDQIHYTRNLLYVSSFAFQRNFTNYCLTGSKTALKLTNAWEPSGSYTTVSKILSVPVRAPECPPGDVHITIDNSQKVGHSSGRIREGSKVPISICTTVGYLQPDPVTYLQANDALAPKHWLRTVTEEDIKLLGETEAKYYNVFRKYRTNYINDVIRNVKEEQCLLAEEVTDYVDISVEQKKQLAETTVCCKCRHVYLIKDEAICPACKFDPDRHVSGYDLYYRTESQHPPLPPKVVIGDPCMVNPNGKENIMKVMAHIKQQADVGGKRKWIIVWSDGLPFTQAVSLQESIFTCSVCQQDIDINKLSFKQHCIESHSKFDQSGINFERMFGDILFLPGPGHIELNMAKLLLSFCWVPFLSHLAGELGFRTAKALDVVKHGVDHHRSRKFCM